MKAIIFGLFILLGTTIVANAETQTITESGTYSCSVYCYVAEEDEVIIIPKIFIEEPNSEKYFYI